MALSSQMVTQRPTTVYVARDRAGRVIYVGITSQGHGQEVAEFFQRSNASGKVHDIGFYEWPESQPSCCRVRVVPRGDRGRFLVVGAQVSFRWPAPWLAVGA